MGGGTGSGVILGRAPRPKEQVPCLSFSFNSALLGLDFFFNRGEIFLSHGASDGITSHTEIMTSYLAMSFIVSRRK